ncbi:hypothetical protein B0H16DRAFT_1465419 [Mycena metata]|uniref:Secreted protein n=1 Tax=Mycena metata TaxID=1033252 RepID=A0AAD7IB68_9AGAR|nr:hypothetical protein B0H16DRAFT_1465419 [Mycena metata]
MSLTGRLIALVPLVLDPIANAVDQSDQGNCPPMITPFRVEDQLVPSVAREGARREGWMRSVLFVAHIDAKEHVIALGDVRSLGRTPSGTPASTLAKFRSFGQDSQLHCCWVHSCAEELEDKSKTQFHRK